MVNLLWPVVILITLCLNYATIWRNKRNPQELSIALIRLLDTPRDERQLMGIRARKLAEKYYSRERIINIYENYDLSIEYKDKMKTFYADIETDSINLGSQMGIRGVPTLILFKKGVETDRLVGGVPEKAVREWLDKSV